MRFHAVAALLNLSGCRAEFTVFATTNTVVVDDVRALNRAQMIVEELFREIDATCSRFRADSELSRLNARAGETVALSPLLDEAIRTALQTAQMTDGLVDLTVGRKLQEIGYTVTFRDIASNGPALELRVEPIAGWKALDYNPTQCTIRIPRGTAIDLGASGKAWAADKAAAEVASQLGVGVLVECGGDVAVNGPTPQDGWPVRVGTEGDAEDVVIFDGGLATSGTTARRWRRGETELHHIIDPATGLPAQTKWAMASVAAATCVEANAAATAALILSAQAPEWLERHHLPARLIAKDGSVHHLAGWKAA